MKIFVKTLKGTHFEIEVKPEDTVRPFPCSILFSLNFYCVLYIAIWIPLCRLSEKVVLSGVGRLSNWGLIRVLMMCLFHDFAVWIGCQYFLSLYWWFETVHVNFVVKVLEFSWGGLLGGFGLLLWDEWNMMGWVEIRTFSVWLAFRAASLAKCV